MTHTTTFTITNNSANNTFPKSTDYSKAIDNIIAANIAACNPYLKGCIDAEYKPDFITLMMQDSAKKHGIYVNGGCNLKNDPEFIKAANFLADYKKNKKSSKKIPFIFGKIYKLIDGTPIAFYDDEIQIGLDLYSYDDFKNITFLNSLPSNTKKTIINIFTGNSTNINISIN